MPRPYHPGPQYTFTSPFGERPPNGTHHGIDYAAPEGTDIPAAADGTVVYSGQNSIYGNTVIVEHSDYSGNPVYTLYAHLKDNTQIGKGSKVSAGDKIGEVGHTGKHRGNTGNHLHIEVIKPDARDRNGTPVWDHNGGVERMTTAESGPIGLHPGVGRKDPETYDGYRGEAFGKGHPKHKKLVNDMIAKVPLTPQPRKRKDKTSPKPITRSNTSGSRGGGSGDNGTLVRHGEQIYRIDPDGKQRGSFYSP